jgi:hypothetical protein
MTALREAELRFKRYARRGEEARRKPRRHEGVGSG